MEFGRLVCEPLSVQEVIDEPELDNKHIAVHGLIYKGKGCHIEEWLLLPKAGPFDGVGPIPMPGFLDRSKCLLIEQPGLGDKLGPSGAAGLYYWKADCIVVGQIRHHPGTDHPFRIGELWVLLIQDWLDSGKGQPFHQIRMILFSQPDSVELPWNGPTTRQHGNPVIRINS